MRQILSLPKVIEINIFPHPTNALKRFSNFAYQEDRRASIPITSKKRAPLSRGKHEKLEFVGIANAGK